MWLIVTAGPGAIVQGTWVLWNPRSFSRVEFGRVCHYYYAEWYISSSETWQSSTKWERFSSDIEEWV